MSVFSHGLENEFSEIHQVFDVFIGLSTPDKLSQLARPAGGFLSTTKTVQDFIPRNCKAITDKLAPNYAQDNLKFKISFV